MKGVVLHGGSGTRLRPFTFIGPKQLMPIANKPVSEYVVRDLVACDIKEIAIILGGTHPERVKNHYRDGSSYGVKITYIDQGEPLGIAHAVGLSRDFVDGDKFVVYLGDNMIQNGIKPYLERFIANDYDAMVLLKEVADPKQFGVAELDDKGKLIRLVEKPEDPPSNYALTGIYFFTPVIFKAIGQLRPSWRGELEITDAIQKLIDWGFNVGYEFVKGWWVDTGKKDDILQVNALVLDERGRREIRGETLNSLVEGRVEIAEDTKIINSTIRGPAIIGSGCVIENSYIGPYTSIWDNTTVINSSVEYCVIMKNVVIRNVERLEESLIGNYTRVETRYSNRRALKLQVGDYSEVLL
ncbi:MAG: glucose-1-phosphate thymidylyltransferase [Aigarchaeota archaeon]|nr:glucose-1-phosphate thymidylyltransferase [Aigarchaeota archaeon]MDW8092644.1 glucose-1-phosphate thymidylyltransferase [Nitrososphaerota archaeon]